MPLDLNCPKCQRVFPVTEARHPVGVQCPGCDAELTAEFLKLAAPAPGQPPYELLVSVGRPTGSPQALAAGKKVRAADEAEERGGGSMAVVVVAGLGALLVALGGLTATGYFLFTNLDTSDSAIGSVNNSTNTKGNTKGNQPNTRPGQRPAPGPGPGPIHNPGEPFDPPKFDPPRFEPPKTDFDLRTAAGTAQAINPPPIDLSKPVTLALPGPAEAVTVGGNGRYVVFHILHTQQLTVFDASKGSFVATERIPDAGPLKLAGGQNRVVTCDFMGRTLRSYTLPELKKEFDFTNPLFHSVSGIALGSGVNSPLLVSDPFAHVALMELTNSGANLVEGSKTEQPVGVPFQPDGTMRAAPNGKLFLFGLRGNDRGEKVGVLTESGRKWKATSVDMTTASPSADSRFLLGFGQLVEANSGKRLGNWVGNDGSAVWYVGGTCGRACLRLAETKQNGQQVVSITAHTNPLIVEKDKTAVQVGVLPETEGLIDWFRGIALPLDRHLFLIPDAKLLVVLPATKDKIVLRKVDVR